MTYALNENPKSFNLDAFLFCEQAFVSALNIASGSLDVENIVSKAEIKTKAD